MDTHIKLRAISNVQVAPGGEGEEPLDSWAVQLDVTLRYQATDHERVAIRASSEGLFVESLDPLPLDALVQVVCALPDGAMCALASVDRVVLPEEAAFVGGLPGLALRFLLMDSQLRGRWEGFLANVQDDHTAAPKEEDETDRSVRKVLRLSRRSSAQRRRRGRLHVRVGQEQENYYTLNVSLGGMFIATARPLPIGSKVAMFVEHPVSSREFSLEAEVRWTKQEGPEEGWGMGVQLVEGAGEGNQEFLRFINEG
tara:strand:- start:107 stop:871 length:765 start_codon:yes stop_codon:yes gene_type:complete